MRKESRSIPSWVLCLPCLFLACGGGGSQATTPSVPAPTNVSTFELTGLSLAAPIAFTVSGKDTSGTTWTGTQVITSKGATTLTLPEATAATAVYEKDIAISIASGSSTPVSYTSLTQEYFTERTDFATLAEWQFTSGATVYTGYPITLQSALPTSISTGSTGNGWSFSYTSGTSTEAVASSWTVTDPGTGYLEYQLTTTLNGNNSSREQWLLDAAGQMTSGQLILYNFPYGGESTTLAATRQ